jgi:hypothetical protein
LRSRKADKSSANSNRLLGPKHLLLG